MTQFDTSVFISKFVEEARDRLKSLGEALLRLEHAPGAPAPAINAAIDQAMREAHSLKGSALMLGLTDISQVSHLLEDLFVAARKNTSLIGGDGFDVVFAAVDVLSARIEQLARGQLEPAEIGDLGRKLKALLTGDEQKASDPVATSVLAKDAGVSPKRGPELRQSL